MSSGRRRGSRRESASKKTVNYLLETGTLANIREAKQRTQHLLDYHWSHYSELAYQRNQQNESITRALVSSATSDFKFTGWQRAVKYKYSLHPLGTLGSLTNIGGRFNTGKDVNSNVPVHSALYLAIDKDTALQETLGQEPDRSGRLSPQEIALTNPMSESILAVSGQLDHVIDLTTPKSLTALMGVLKHFVFSRALRDRAKELGLEKPTVIQTPRLLHATLTDRNWRDWPQNLDVPSNSQIFGHLLLKAGIEGVLYLSKLTGKQCLAVFPKNFESTSSFIQLDDEPPHPRVPRRIDHKSWPLCELNFDDLNGDGLTKH